MEERGIEHNKLAKLCCVSVDELQKIIDGEKSISYGMALMLEEHVGHSARFWANAQIKWGKDV